MSVDPYSYVSNSNGAFVEDLYQKFLTDPESVEFGWRKFFEGYEFSSGAEISAAGVQGSNKEVAVSKLITAYRSRGHLIADTNPVRERRAHKADLELDYFGLSEADLDESFDAGHEIGVGRATLRDILARLQATYSGSIGVEFMYSRDPDLRQWMYREMEPNLNRPKYSNEKRRYILNKISAAVNFEGFLQTKYVGKKRFSLEGIESLIPSLDAAVNEGAKLGVEEFVFGMAHRGRLNVLVNIFGKTPEQVFAEFDEQVPDDVTWSGDVKYHMGRSADVKTIEGKEVHLSLVPNPSHLEAVNPVVQGMVYAKSQKYYGGDAKRIMPILIHGDAAFAGQGVNYELVNMSELEGYRVHGTVHIVLNNQVGFTADYKEGRSSIYCTDLAKVTESPVFHVNADDPEAVVHAVEMAIKFRQEFGRDVYVDILGYRRYGHNEGDEPRFTQPKLYKTISKHPNVYQILLKQLLSDGVIGPDVAKAEETTFKSGLQKRLEASRKGKAINEYDKFSRFWKGFRDSEAKDFEASIDTGIKKSILDTVAQAITHVSEEMSLFTKMKKLLAQRETHYQNGQVDWAMGELLAYGSLLLDGRNVRISGQDSQRGTFSHRHAVIKDFESETQYVPLNNIQDKQASLCVLNSHLSEYCVMGFEYGVSMSCPEDLTIWEAQFGDFSNGAQIVIDQFISSSESKWQRWSGLTLMLPHGYEGQGPEHSSARLERYLQLCAENNMYVVNVTTPANYFHLLRRQVMNSFRIPLVIMTPKSLLRHPLVVSQISELESGRFLEVLDDVRVKAAAVRQVVLCSGKVYYDLLQYAEENKVKDIAIVRLEQLYPLPQNQLLALKKKYGKARWTWVQEEPANMGAWSHVLRHLSSFGWNVVSRPEAASPAVGNSKVSAEELAEILKEVFQ